MRALSAVDSVSPAVERTKDFLFRPFRWGTYLKLGLVAVVTEGVGGNLNSSSGGGHGSHTPEHAPTLPPSLHLAPEWAAVIVASVLIVIVISIVLFYLVTRLRFAFFHSLVHNTKEIGSGWRLYRPQAGRFFWLNVVVGLCYLFLFGLVALPFISGFWRLIQETSRGGQPDVWQVLPLVLPLIPLVFLLALLGIATDIVLRDLMLPHYALEDASAGQAWTEVWARIQAEKRQFFVYALLRLVLPTIATIGLFIVLLIPGLMVAGALAAIEFGLHSAFADATGAASIAGIALEVFFGVLAFGFALLASVCLGGPVSTSIREYALVFYGGRYAALGRLLYPQSQIVDGTMGIS